MGLYQKIQSTFSLSSWAGRRSFNEPIIVGSADAWGNVPKPSDSDLLEANVRTVAACVERNVLGCTAAKLRFFTRNPKSFAEKHRKSITAKTSFEIRKQFQISTTDEVEEIMTHPMIDFFTHGHEIHSRTDLFSYLFSYQDTAGHAYLWIGLDSSGKPSHYEIMPPQFCEVIKDQTTGYPVGIKFSGEKGQTTTYPLKSEEGIIIPFCGLNLADPLSLRGVSPLSKVWEMYNVERKMLATEAALLENGAQMQGIYSFDNPVTPQIAERARLQFENMTRGGRGKVLFNQYAGKFDPTQMSPHDLSFLQIARDAHVQIMRCYGVPIALLESSQYNRATLEASLIQHVRDAVAPRLNRFQEVLNKFYVPLWDETGDVFCAFDDQNPQNRQLLLQEIHGLVTDQIMWRNEARREYDLPPVEGGDSFTNIQGQDPTGSPTGEESTDIEAVDNPDAVKLEDPVVATDTQAKAQAALNEVVGGVERWQSLIYDYHKGILLPPAYVKTLMQFYLMPEDAAISFIEALGPPNKNAVEPAPAFPQPTVAEDKPEEEIEESNQGGNESQAKGMEADLISLKSKKNPKSFQLDEPGDGSALAEKVAGFFGKQEAQILKALKNSTKSQRVIKDFKPVGKWDKELAAVAQPYIEISFADAGKQLLQKVGASQDKLSVFNPKVAEAAKDLALSFAESTNKTTLQSLNSALDGLRKEIEEGLVEGDRLSEMTARVKSIFTGLKDNHAKVIARTETSRSYNLGAKAAAIESGVVTKMRWLLSPDPCPECAAMEGTEVEIEGSFGEKEEWDNENYAEQFPPLHPNCFCSIEWVLDIQDSGVNE